MGFELATLCIGGAGRRRARASHPRHPYCPREASRGHRHGRGTAGDALLRDRHGRLREPDPGLSLDPDQASASAATLRSLQPSLLLPGHGAPVRG